MRLNDGDEVVIAGSGRKDTEEDVRTAESRSATPQRNMPMDELSGFAQAPRPRAGQLIKDVSKNPTTSSSKPTTVRSPSVDLAINQRISQAIKAAYPEHGCSRRMSHGSGTEALQNGSVIPGRHQVFVLGVPLSTAILGLMEHGKLVTGGDL